MRLNVLVASFVSKRLSRGVTMNTKLKELPVAERIRLAEEGGLRVSHSNILRKKDATL